MNTFKQAMLRALEEGQSLDRIANAGIVSMSEALEYLKSAYPAMPDAMQELYEDLEWDANNGPLAEAIRDEVAMENDGDTYEKHCDTEGAQVVFI